MKTKDVRILDLKIGDVRCFNNGTDAIVKEIVNNNGICSVIYTNGRSSVQAGSIFCRILEQED